MSLSKKPNFFIVGAARSGTTTLYQVLKKHPEVFMPPEKEPSFFAGEYKNNERTWPEYLALFKGAKNEKIIGEASTRYLYSQEAAKEINSKIENPKILIQLREPVARAISQYRKIVRDENEGLNFRQALAKEEERIKKGASPNLHYISRSYYFPQVKKFYDVFDRNSIKVTIFEEFIKDSKKVLREICEFLEIDPKLLSPIIGQYNRGNKIRFPKIRKFIGGNSKTKKLLKTITPKSIRDKLRTSFLIDNLNATSSQIEVDFSGEEKAELRKKFLPDIEKLEKLINKDLSTWKT